MLSEIVNVQYNPVTDIYTYSAFIDGEYFERTCSDLDKEDREELKIIVKNEVYSKYSTGPLI